MVYVPILKIDLPEPRLQELLPGLVRAAINTCTRVFDAVNDFLHPLSPEEQLQLYTATISHLPREFRKARKRCVEKNITDPDKMSEELEDAAFAYYRCRGCWGCRPAALAGRPASGVAAGCCCSRPPPLLPLLAGAAAPQAPHARDDGGLLGRGHGGHHVSAADDAGKRDSRAGLRRRPTRPARGGSSRGWAVQRSSSGGGAARALAQQGPAADGDDARWRCWAGAGRRHYPAGGAAGAAAQGAAQAQGPAAGAARQRWRQQAFVRPGRAAAGWRSRRQGHAPHDATQAVAAAGALAAAGGRWHPAAAGGCGALYDIGRCRWRVACSSCSSSKYVCMLMRAVFRISQPSCAC